MAPTGLFATENINLSDCRCEMLIFVVLGSSKHWSQLPWIYESSQTFMVYVWLAVGRPGVADSCASIDISLQSVRSQ